MKNKTTLVISYSLLVISSLVIASRVLAITPKVSPAEEVASEEAQLASPSAQVDKEVQDLKDKVAKKVAELQEKDQKAVSGMVTLAKGNNITIKTFDEREIVVKVDETITKIFSIADGIKEEVKSEDVEKDFYLVVTGPMIGNTVTANYIYIDEEYLVKSGKITETDAENFVIKLLSSEKDMYTLDFETSTKAQIVNTKTFETEKIGFTKIKVGDTIHFVIKRSDEGKEKNRYPALRMLIIPQEYFLK